MALGREFLATFREVGATKLQGAFNGIARSTEKLNTGLKKSGDTSVRTQRRFSELGVTIGSLAKVTAGLTIGKWLADSAMGAARMETNLANTAAILGDVAATDIAQWAEENAAALNVSQVAATDAARKFAAYALEVEQAGGNSAQFTQDMIRLSAEVSAFSGKDPALVIEALTGAMRGEFDTLQGLGLNINAAAINQKALELGLAATTKELTAQDKTLATYMELLDLGAKFMGTTARNADSLTIQMANLKQETADLGTEIGRTLIPSLSAAATGFSGLIVAFNTLPGPVRTFILVLTGVMVASRLLGPSIARISLSLKLLRAEMALTAGAGAKFGAVMAAMRSMFNPWILGITAALTVLTLWISKNQQAKQAAEEWAQGIDAVTGALNEQGQALLVDNIKDLKDNADEAGVSMKELTAVVGTTKAYDALIDKLYDVAAADSEWKKARGGGYYSYGKEGQAALDLIDDLKDLRSEYTNGKEIAEAIAEAQQGVAESLGNTNVVVDLTAVLFEHLDSVVKDTTKSFDDFIDSFSIINQAMADSKAAVVDYEQAIDDLSEGLIKGGKSFDPDLQAGRDNIENLASVAEGVSNRALEILKNRGPAEANKFIEDEKKRITDLLIAAGKTPAEARGLVEDAFKTPVAIKIELDKGGIEKYNKDLARLRRQKHRIQAEFDPTKFGSADAAERAGAEMDKQLKPIEAKINAAVTGKHEAKQELEEITDPMDPRVADIKPFIPPADLASVQAQLDNLTRDRYANIYLTPLIGDLLPGANAPNPFTSPRAVEGQAGTPAPSANRTPVTPKKDNVNVNVYVDGRRIDSTATASRGRGRGRAA